MKELTAYDRYQERQRIAEKRHIEAKHKETNMKTLSKLHQEAIIKAQNATDQNRAAAIAMIEKPVELIKAIMLKHELAVIEVMRELHEAKEAAVRTEREACAKLCDHWPYGRDDVWSLGQAIRARGKQ